MDWRIFIAVALVALLVASTMLVTLGSDERLEVAGGLSKREVDDIRLAVRRVIFPPILPDVSAGSLRAAPGLILKRLAWQHPKVCRIEARTGGFVAVIGRLPRASEWGEKYVFWGVFRGTNEWWVGHQCYLSEYRVK